MAIVPYLAMTAAEMQNAPSLPEKCGWMACHFSPYGTGLSNIPRALPDGSLLILNDRTPIQGHDPERIVKQLKDTISRLHCCGLLLDFQQEQEELKALAEYLTEALPCPVAAPERYASEKCGVFLPPVPLDTPIRDYLSAWRGKSIWLDTAMSAACITVTETGSTYHSLCSVPPTEKAFADEALHCHYKISQSDTEIRFQLYRTDEDLLGLLAEAKELGIENAVGLYQELGHIDWPPERGKTAPG